MRQLYKSHRTLGYEVARTRTGDGKELVILEIVAHKQEVSPTHMLRAVSQEEAAFEVRVGLAQLIKQARFLGVDAEMLRPCWPRNYSKSSKIPRLHKRLRPNGTSATLLMGP